MNINHKDMRVRRRLFGLLPARAVIYTRDLDSHKQIRGRGPREALGIAQDEACRLLADGLGLRIVHRFSDYDPWDLRLRTKLVRAVERAAAWDVDYLIVFTPGHLEGGLDSLLDIGLTLGAGGTEVLAVDHIDPELARRAQEPIK